MGNNKRHYLKLLILLGLPLVFLLGLMEIREKYRYSFSIIDQQYGGDWNSMPVIKIKNTILLRTKFEYRFMRPGWWRDISMDKPSLLKFVSATMEDSQHHDIRLNIVKQSQLFPGDSPTEEDLRSVQQHIFLRPSGDYDLSSGGRLRVRMKIPSRLTNSPPYWEGEASIGLPPTNMKAH